MTFAQSWLNEESVNWCCDRNFEVARVSSFIH